MNILLSKSKSIWQRAICYIFGFSSKQKPLQLTRYRCYILVLILLFFWAVIPSSAMSFCFELSTVKQDCLMVWGFACSWHGFLEYSLSISSSPCAWPSRLSLRCLIPKSDKLKSWVACRGWVYVVHLHPTEFFELQTCGVLLLFCGGRGSLAHLK